MSRLCVSTKTRTTTSMMSCSVFLWAWSWKQSSLQRFGCFIDERSNLLISSKLEEKSTNWEVALYSKKMKIKQSYSRTNTKWNDDFTAWIIDSLSNQRDSCVFSVLNIVLSISILFYTHFSSIFPYKSRNNIAWIYAPQVLYDDAELGKLMTYSV